MKLSKICKMCGKRFRTRIRTTKFCHYICRNRYNRRLHTFRKWQDQQIAMHSNNNHQHEQTQIQLQPQN